MPFVGSKSFYIIVGSRPLAGAKVRITTYSTKGSLSPVVFVLVLPKRASGENEANKIQFALPNSLDCTQ